MILLVSASPKAAECASAIEEVTRRKTLHCGSAAKAAHLSRSGEFEIIVLDLATINAGPTDAEVILHNAGVALPVYVNSGLMATPRITSEVKAALQRVDRERRVAMREAEALVRNEMKDEITGILLAAELALSSPGLPQFAADKMRDIHQLATRMRGRFESAQ